jgi:hypothetical protein
VDDLKNEEHAIQHSQAEANGQLRQIVKANQPIDKKVGQVNQEKSGGKIDLVSKGGQILDTARHTLNSLFSRSDEKVHVYVQHDDLKKRKLQNLKK